MTAIHGIQSTRPARLLSWCVRPFDSPSTERRSFMRMCVLLALTAGSLLAADPPKGDEATKEAEKVFRTMEEKLTKAKTLECVFDVKLGTVSYDGSVFLAEGNRAR